MECGNMSINSKMTALADEIRELSGTTTKKSIDTMTSDINTANTEITEQSELIEQIVTALEGKAGGSGGITLPELTDPASASDILSGKEAIDGDGNKITGTIATRTADNISVEGWSVFYGVANVQAGYYPSNTSKYIPVYSNSGPNITIDNDGKITAPFYITKSGWANAGTITPLAKQLTTKSATTITPTTSEQIAVAKNVYTTGAIKVAAIPSNYEDVGAETTEYTSLNGELEEVINSLPEAGGSGGSIETCTVGCGFGTFYFTLNHERDLYDLFASYSNACTILKGSFILVPDYISGFPSYIEPSGAVEKLESVRFKSQDCCWYKVNDSISILVDD
jgi:hypothetical protein